jgi:hypothetical protein
MIYRVIISDDEKTTFNRRSVDGRFQGAYPALILSINPSIFPCLVNVTQA